MLYIYIYVYISADPPVLGVSESARYTAILNFRFPFLFILLILWILDSLDFLDSLDSRFSGSLDSWILRAFVEAKEFYWQGRIRSIFV